MRAEVAGTPVDLTPTEFTLLATLAGQPGRIFTRGQLLDALHGVAFESYERAIDSHVKNLRRKLEPDPREPRYVLTVYGVGYRFADDRDDRTRDEPDARRATGPRAAREREVRQRMWRMRRRQRELGPRRGRRAAAAAGARAGEAVDAARSGAASAASAGLVFLLVASSVSLRHRLDRSASLATDPRRRHVVVVAAMHPAGVGRGLRGAARSLDQIVEAQERVKVGDYAVRVGRPASPLPPDPRAGRRLRHDGRAARRSTSSSAARCSPT